MATYKVIQDIEAEDHILGPLTLRQFIYALTAVFFFYLSFIVITKHATVMLLVVFPPGAFAAFFAFPFKRDQPTEVWALAKLRYMLKPRRRLWNQSGTKELVTINVPKKIERPLTNGLSQTEVHNRLQVLATTIDTRGWAVKNVAMMPSETNSTIFRPQNSDRLIDPSSIPKPVPDFELAASDDMLDELNNPIAAQFTNLIDESSREHRQKIMESLNAARQEPADQPWFTQDESKLSQQLHRINSVKNLSTANLHTLPTSLTNKPQTTTMASTQQPAPQTIPGSISTQSPTQTNTNSNPTTQPNTTPQRLTKKDPAILNLAYNDDLNVSTIANVAKQSQSPDGEVVINLH